MNTLVRLFTLVVAGFVLANTALLGGNPAGNIVEISARVESGIDDRSPIVGFQKADWIGTVMGRAMGPSLGQFGVSGYMVHPMLSLYDQNTHKLVLQNDDWQADATNLKKVAADVAAFPFSVGLTDAAFTANLPTGLYSYVIQPKDGVNGIALLELYKTLGNRGFPNISCRGIVGKGESVMILGFVIGDGIAPATRVLLEGVGSGLKPWVSTAANKVSIILFQNDGKKQWALVPDATGKLAWKDAATLQPGEVTNGSWDADATNAKMVAAYGSEVGAFSLARGSGDAGIVLTLSPGTYTMQVISDDPGEPVGLGQVFDATVALPPTLTP